MFYAVCDYFILLYIVVPSIYYFNMKTKALKVAHLNVRSLQAHLREVETVIGDNDLDVLGVTETWLTARVSSDSLGIRGYKFVRRDYAGRGSGVGFYIRDQFRHQVCPSSDAIEQLCISLHLNSFKIVLNVMYRNHHVDHNKFIEELEITIGNSLLMSDRVYALGDMNINMLRTSDLKTVDYCRALGELGLSQLITEPTRGDSLIDHVLAVGEENVLESGVVDVDFSDHDLVFLILNLKIPRVVRFVTCRDFKNFDEELFLEDLLSAGLEAIYYINDIDHKVAIFNKVLTDLFDKYAPVRTMRMTKPYAPWLTDNIKFLMSLRDRAKASYRRTLQRRDWEEYKRLRNLTTLSVNNEKKAYLRHKLSSTNSKAVYKELKSLKICGNRNRSSLAHIGTADEINRLFVGSVPRGDPVDFDTFDFYNRSRHVNSGVGDFEFTLIDNSVTIRLIDEIKATSSGPDALNINMIKTCGIYVISFITNIINSCILQNIFPSEWKQSYVLPLPKVAEPEHIGDLRSINILPVLSKVFERFLYKHLMKYILDNELLPEVQSGFRPNHSCTTALLSVSDDILRATDKGQYTLLVLLDFSRAFDTIRLDLLFSILRYIGLGMDAVSLMKNYPTERDLRVLLEAVVGRCCWALTVCNLHPSTS